MFWRDHVHQTFEVLFLKYMSFRTRTIKFSEECGYGQTYQSIYVTPQVFQPYVADLLRGIGLSYEVTKTSALGAQIVFSKLLVSLRTVHTITSIRCTESCFGTINIWASVAKTSSTGNSPQVVPYGRCVHVVLAFAADLQRLLTNGKAGLVGP